MSTTDSNGLVVLDENDPLIPYQTTVNTVTASVSGALDLTVRTFKAANQAARDALATQRPPSPSHPLQVWRVDKKYFEINDGSGWRSISSDPTKEIIDGTAYSKSGSVSVNITSWYLFATNQWSGYTTAPLPYTPPEGWDLQVNLLRAPADDVVAMTARQPNNLVIRARYIWTGNPGSKNFTLGWQLVRR